MVDGLKESANKVFVNYEDRYLFDRVRQIVSLLAELELFLKSGFYKYVAPDGAR